jgi:hypothetical protein
MKKQSEIEKFLLERISRRNIDFLIERVIENPALFDELYAIAFSENTKAAWRAAWVLSHLNERESSFLRNKIPDLMRFIPIAKHDGISRSFLNIVLRVQPQECPVEFINLCFDWAFSPRQPIAIQGICLKILLNICRLYPEFAEELIACLENADPNDYTKGFAAARRNTLKQLRSK